MRQQRHNGQMPVVGEETFQRPQRVFSTILLRQEDAVPKNVVVPPSGCRPNLQRIAADRDRLAQDAGCCLGSECMVQGGAGCEHRAKTVAAAPQDVLAVDPVDEEAVLERTNSFDHGNGYEQPGLYRLAAELNTVQHGAATDGESP